MGTKVEELLGILSSSLDEGADRTDEGENAAAAEEVPSTEPSQPQGVEEDRPKFTPSAAFSRKDTHPIVLDVLLLHRYGPLWLSWEADTLWSEIEHDFRVPPSVHSRNKINAVKTLHLVDTPWTQWEVFSVVVQALTDNIPDFRMLQKPSITQIMPAMDMIKDVNNERSYSEEVGRYIAACFLDDGVFYLPKPVDFAQQYAAMSRYRCTRCGNIDTDTDNEMCDSCGAPDKYLEKAATNDPEPVRARYDQTVGAGVNRNFWLQEDTVDVQVAKLLLADMRVRQFQDRLKTQMEALRG